MCNNLLYCFNHWKYSKRALTENQIQRSCKIINVYYTFIKIDKMTKNSLNRCVIYDFRWVNANLWFKFPNFYDDTFSHNEQSLRGLVQVPAKRTRCDSLSTIWNTNGRLIWILVFFTFPLLLFPVVLGGVFFLDTLV